MDPLTQEKELNRELQKTMAQGEGRPSRWPWLVAVLMVGLAVVLVWLYWGESEPPGSAGPGTEPKVVAPQAEPGAPPGPQPAGAAEVPPPPSKGEHEVYHLTPGQDPPSGQAAEQARRKEPWGLDESLDAVVRTDESIKVGDQVVAVGELEKKMVVEQRGEVLDKPLGPDAERKVAAWGVHVVRPGENLWDIHYRLLREYMAARGVKLPEDADQPDPQGRSSGVGKILKFAENMVGVYNLKTGKMTTDLDVLEPGAKMVVFNLSEIFQQLAKIDPNHLSGVMYDGRVLLFPQRAGESGS